MLKPMEKFKGLQNAAAEDVSAFQSWPLIQHEFFPGQDCKDLPQGTRQTHPFRPSLFSNASANPESPWGWEQFSRLDGGNGNDLGSRHWRDCWESNSFSCTVQQHKSTVMSHHSVQGDPDPVLDPKLKSPLPCNVLEATGLCDESTLLDLGLRNSSAEDDGLLTLKLGGNGYSCGREDQSPSIKRSRHSPPETQQPRCQVDNCSADLHNAKDYHRRHKVCEMHAKALKAPVSRIMQRFCQQCSRFHHLQEFDEDRRSCRRRLAGHNRRRRKTKPDAAAVLACLLADRNPLTTVLNSLAQLQGKDELERLLKVLNGGDVLLQTLLRANTMVENGESRSADMENTSHDLVDAVAKSQILTNLLFSNSSLAHSVPFVAPAESSISALSSALLASLSHRQQDSQQAVQISSSKQQELSIVEIQDKQLRLKEIDSNSVNATVFPAQQDGSFKQLNLQQPVSQSLLSSAEGLQSIELPNLQSRFIDKANQVNGNMVDDRMHAANVQRRSLNHCLNQTDEVCLRENVCVQKGREGLAAIVSDQGATLEPASENLQIVGAMKGGAFEYVPFDSQSTPPEEPIDTPTLGSDESLDSGLDIQDRTYRIVFKLFDRGLGELPSSLRKQILEWLDHLPTDLDTYVRPGCVILTIFLCMPVHAWERLCTNIEVSLLKLVQSRDGEFWCKGRVLVQLGKASASIIEGKVYPRSSLKSISTPHLLLVRPFAIVMGENAQLIVRGCNLKVPGTKLICAYGGKYTDKEVTLLDPLEREQVGEQHEQILTLQVGPFNVLGHGFLEVEGQHHDGNAFPLIVAEKAVCEEISSLEEELEMSIMTQRTIDKTRQSLIETEITHFLYELGWLFQRTQQTTSWIDSGMQEFSSARFKWLLRFAVEHSWCAVVVKILDLLFSIGSESNEVVHSKALKTLSEVSLLHVAVRVNSRPVVDVLLSYSPPSTGCELRKDYVFRPDTPGLAGLTPLHIAASMHAADGVIDALTNDPKQLWVSAWTSAKDSTGQTPLMYAMAAGNHAYIRIVQNKLEMGLTEATDDVKLIHGSARSHLALNILAVGEERKSNLPGSASLPGRLAFRRTIQHCTCKNGSYLSSPNLPLRIRGAKGSYRPLVLTMLAIAAVCVCVGVLMKGPPDVDCIRPPFVWEYIKYGYI